MDRGRREGSIKRTRGGSTNREKGTQPERVSDNEGDAEESLKETQGEITRNKLELAVGYFCAVAFCPIETRRTHSTVT